MPVKGGEILSEVNTSNNVKFAVNVPSGTNASKSDSSNVTSINSCKSFKNVLQAKACNVKNTNGSKTSSTNQSSAPSAVNSSEKTIEEKLQDIEKEINDIKSGAKSGDDAEIQSLTNSLQQILGSILAAANTQTSNTNLDATTLSKLTELENDLKKYVDLNVSLGSSQQTGVAVNDSRSKSDEEKLQDIEKEINDIKNGNKSADDAEIQSLTNSLQQILSSLLNNAQSTENSGGNIDTSVISKLSSLANELDKLTVGLGKSQDDKEPATSNQQTVTTLAVNDSSNKTYIEKLQDIEKVINDIKPLGSGDVAILTGTTAQSVSSNLDTNILMKTNDLKSVFQNSVAALGNNQQINSSLSKADTNNDVNTTQTTTDESITLSKIESEINDLMKDMKLSEGNPSLTTGSSKLNYIENLLMVTNKALNTTKLSNSNPLTDNQNINNVTQLDFNATKSSYLSSYSDNSSSNWSNSDSSSNNSGSNFSSKNASSKENDFLNTLIDDQGSSSSDKYSKVTIAINQLLNNNVTSSSDIKNEIPVARSDNFSQDIIKNLKYMDNNDIKNMTVTIAPKELGTVIINITSENGAMKASITATNKEAYNLLNANADQINASLSSQEIKVSNVSINIYNGDTTYFKDGSHSQDSAKQDEKKRKTSMAIVGIADKEIEDTDSVYENDNVNALV